MSAKPVSLAQHRNTVESHRKRLLARAVQKKVERMIREEDIRAYAIVGIYSTGSRFALWDTGATMPLTAFPHVVAQALIDDIAVSGIEDDWRPNLTLRGSVA